MKVIHGYTFEDRSVEIARESPFVAIRIIARFAHRIVGDDVKNQIVRTVIDNLVRFTWGTEDSIACYQFGQSFRYADFASTGDNEIKLRLSGVRVIRTRTRPRTVLGKGLDRMGGFPASNRSFCIVLTRWRCFGWKI
jgi:hypothetical protein